MMQMSRMRTARLWRSWAYTLALAGVFGCGPPGEADPPADIEAPSASAQPKVLLIGMDGADLRWIDRLAAAGRLPNFDRLMQRGVAGSLATVHYASPIIWTSVATGVVPPRHGIGGFLANLKPDGTPYEPGEAPKSKPTSLATSQEPSLPTKQVLPSGRERPATVANRTRPAFWNILSHYERSVGVLAWWATYPAERVNGYMVSPYLLFLLPEQEGTANVDVDWTTEDAAKAFPAALGNELGPMMYKASEIDRERYAAVLGVGRQTPYTPWGLARDRSYYEAALHTLRTRPVDCVAVYFQGPDVASHDFTYFAFGENVNEKRSPRVGKRAFAAAYQRVEAMYETMDELLGGLVDEVGHDTNVIVVSDHGWEYDGTSHWNLDPGTFIAAGPDIRNEGRIEDVSVLDVAPIVLSLLDVPLARAFDGKVPAGVLEPEVEARVTYVDDYPIPAVALAAEPGDAVPEDESMLKLLRGLGYVE
jgi:hypothetical protein